jgi:hypothetical protein
MWEITHMNYHYSGKIDITVELVSLLSGTPRSEIVISPPSSTFMWEITHINYYYSGKIDITVELDGEMTHSYV